MTRFMKKSLTEIGESPYEIKFRGNKKIDEVVLRVIDFDEEQLHELQLNEFAEINKYIHSDSVTWLNIDGLHDPSLLEKIGKAFDLDRIIVSDVLNTDQRPKIQEYDECLYVSIKMMRYNEAEREVVTENLSLVMMEDLLISFQEMKGDVFDPVRERLRKGKKKIRTSGTDYLLFALLDIVIDHYLYILAQLGERIEFLEDQIMTDTSRELLEEIGDLNREINFMRRNIVPAREMIHGISKIESDYFVDEENQVHWQELKGNISLALESADGYKDMLSDMMNIYHTSVSSKLNDVMKFLTIFSVVFIPLTFIAGIYGTNFDNIPELHFEYGYYVMWSVMIAVALGMIYYFKRRGWF